MRRIAIIALMLISPGCAAHRPPRWEIVISLNLEQKLDPNTQIKSGLALKRPAAPYPGEKK